MTLCLLVRHAVHDVVDRTLVGRSDGVSLSEAGHAQASKLADKLRALGVSHVQSSPRERALQTAKPIADGSGVPVDICDVLDEVDFGAWSGRRFDDLAHDDAWQLWNERRDLGRAPGGESMSDVQARIMGHLQRMHAQLPGARIVMVTHAEVIRAAVLRCLSFPHSEWSRIEVAPASITPLQISSTGQARINVDRLLAA
jgi:broad specificity phosphatase PhoE